MAKQSFRDVNTVVAMGVAMSGVERVSLSNEGSVISFGADANPYRQDVGLTKQLAMVTIEKKSSSKLRDIVSAVFTAGATGSATIGRCQRVRAAQRGAPIRDSGDADAWLAYVGVTDIGGEVEVAGRDITQLKGSPFQKGRKGTLTVRVPVQRTGYGLPAATATDTHKFVCMVSRVDLKAEHGGVAAGDLRFEMYGGSPQWTASGLTGSGSLKPLAIGATGSVAFTAPAADASAAEATTVAHGVVTEVELTVEHGAYARTTIKTEHFAPDGVTPPIT